MYKENLYKLIRKEEVIIWAGAGMSLYAGYPSGKRLTEILIENLTSKEKEEIDINIPLPDLAEEFYRIKGNNKNSLLQILNDTFLKKAESKDIHDRLAIIPHFRTIITTNYDSLFEDSYGQKAQKIFKTTQIPYINNKKTQIFKVHGDLSEPESVILTKSDYNNFFKENKDNGTYWSVIRERLATKAVLFLGYNLEDPNVSVIFDRITDSLGENRKEGFLVAPNLPQHKVNNLIKKGIHYIDSTAEKIISELLLHLKEHIISDIETGKTSADTFREFLANIDLLPDLKADKDRYKVTSLKGTKDDIHGVVNFTFKNEKEFIKELNDFANGRKFGTFEIPEDKLLNADFWYGGVKFPNSEGILKLEFKSVPKLETKIDIRFDDGFEYNGITSKLYGSPNLIEIHLEIENADIVVKVDLETMPEIKVKMSYNHKEICKNVKTEIDLFTLLMKLADGKMFTVFPELGNPISKVFPKSSELLKQSTFFYSYFINLKKIENHYNVRFSNIHINSVNDKTIKTVEYLVTVIEEEYLVLDWDDELTMTLIDNYSDEIVEQFKNVNELNAPVVALHKVEEIIELHGLDINLGYKKIEFMDTYVTNLQAIMKREDNIVRMKSRSKKMHVSFTKDLIK
ncbi:MAG: SIR2 family protein [Bacteroidales bacterium]